MARTLSVFRDGLAEVEKANAKVAEEREAATRERRQAMMALASEFEARVMGVVESVNEASGAVQQSAAGMSDSAKGASTKAEAAGAAARSEEHTSELQSLMRISYSVFCLKK